MELYRKSASPTESAEKGIVSGNTLELSVGTSHFYGNGGVGQNADTALSGEWA